MTIVNYDPWSLLRRVETEINNTFLSKALDLDGTVSRRWAPAVDVREHDDRFVFLADVPGVDPEEIAITVGNGVLTIQGNRGKGSSEPQHTLRHTERRQGDFFRRFVLPETVDERGVSASERHGVLEITIAKKEEVQPRKIAVN